VGKFFPDQTAGLAKRSDKQVYGDGGTLRTPSNETNTRIGKRATADRPLGVCGGQPPRKFKLTGRKRTG
jgi:hypothetical protein